MVTRVIKWLLVRGQMHGIHFACCATKSVSGQEAVLEQGQSEQAEGRHKTGTMRSEGSRAMLLVQNVSKVSCRGLPAFKTPVACAPPAAAPPADTQEQQGSSTMACRGGAQQRTQASTSPLCWPLLCPPSCSPRGRGASHLSHLIPIRASPAVGHPAPPQPRLAGQPEMGHKACNGEAAAGGGG